MPDSKLPPLIFHRLPLLKRRKRSGTLVRAGLAELCAQTFSSPISEDALILSTNELFFARCTHGDGRNMPNASRNYCGRAENLSASSFMEPIPSRRLIRSTKHKRQKFLANTFAWFATLKFPIRCPCSPEKSAGRNGNSRKQRVDSKSARDLQKCAAAAGA